MRLIQIHSEERGARLVYVLNFVFKEVLKCDWQFVDAAAEADIVYGQGSTSKVRIRPSIFIQAFQAAKNPEFKNGELFLNNEEHFDVFAAIFFCLSRFEEYDSELDSHQRFSSHSSVFSGALNRPWVDLWIQQIATTLGIENYAVSDFQMTVDLDFGYRFLGKGVFRTIGALARDILKFNLSTAISRINAFIVQRDPYDSVYHWLRHEFTTSELRLFALSAPFSSYDKGLKLRHKAWSKLIAAISGYPVGLHPSYRQMDEPGLLDIGKQNLESFGVNVDSNRFHFLRFSLPTCYQNLLDRGIYHDYSMGFADTLGFRAQTSRSFLFYDLTTEQITPLRIHPFVYMDAVLCNYATLTEQEILQQVGSIIDEIKHIGGHVCLLWHEHTLVENTQTRGLLEKLLPLLKPLRDE